MSDRSKVDCRDCEGFGYHEHTRHITDYNSGHDIWTEHEECETCCGQGWIWSDEVDWDEDEDE